MNLETPQITPISQEEMLNQQLEELEQQKQAEMNAYINDLKASMGGTPQITEIQERLPRQEKIITFRKEIKELPNLNDKQKATLYRKLDEIGAKFMPSPSSHAPNDGEIDLDQFKNYLDRVRNGEEKVEETEEKKQEINKEEPKTLEELMKSVQTPVPNPEIPPQLK